MKHRLQLNAIASRYCASYPSLTLLPMAGNPYGEERDINTGEVVMFAVHGDNLEAVYMIPGWTHNFIILSETVDLVTVMIWNEMFNPERTDTFWK